MQPPAYPKRPSHFALKAVRAMVKTCVANEFGPEVFALVTVIAATEDAAHYRRPVTFHGGQLMPLIGVMSETTFKRVRQRAVDSGWLVYIPGAKRKPASYFVNIPRHAQGLDDKPSDEGDESDFSPDSGSHSGPDSGPNTGSPVTHNQNTGPHSGSPVTQNRTRIEPESGLNPDPIRPPFIPNPIPNPVPIPPPTPSRGQTSEQEASLSVELPTEPPHIAEQLDAAANELIVTWNGLRGVKRHARNWLSSLERGTLERWMFGDRRVDWRAMLKKFPLAAFPPDVDGGFQPTLGWLMQEKNWTAVLDGLYDFKPGQKPQAASPRTRVRLGELEQQGAGRDQN